MGPTSQRCSPKLLTVGRCRLTGSNRFKIDRWDGMGQRGIGFGIGLMLAHVLENPLLEPWSALGDR